MKRFLPYFLLTGIVLVAFFLRLKDLHAPLADWHSFRQADTASVAFEYATPTLAPVSALLTPQYHDLSNIQSGLENPNGYRMVELPLINYFVAFIVHTLPSLTAEHDLVWVYRLVHVVFAVANIVVIFQLVKVLSKNTTLALLTATIITGMPYSIFYSRTILPEIPLLFFMYASLLSFAYWLKKPRSLGLLLVTWLLLATSFLVKPIAVFMAPAFLVLAVFQFGFWGSFMQPGLWVLSTAVFPVLAWRTHIQQFPEGIPANNWLFNENGIRLKPSWWRWLFAERIGFHMLGYWATGFSLIGILSTQRTKLSSKISSFDWFVLSLASGWFAYLVIFATGNVQHDYYQIPLIPVIGILTAKGIYWLYQQLTKSTPAIFVFAGITSALLLSTFLSWNHIRSYYGINNQAIVEAGIYIRQILPHDAKVIAPYMGDTAFLFQTQRRGWPIGHYIDAKIEAGATHYVSTSYDDEARELEQQFVTIEKNELFIIFDLTMPLE